ncbi:MAG: serine/threonine-protein kinase [Planctomycetaceae bacterium]
MNSSTTHDEVPTEKSADRDARLFEVLDGLVRQQRNGTAIDIEAACKQHPDLAHDLRELWMTAMLAEDFGSCSGDLNVTPATLSAGLLGLHRLEQRSPRLPEQIGDYEILDELGRGGMGVVYKARQASLGRIVALKMILQGDLASTVDRARFRGEAEAAAKLQHPHIVPVYEVGEQDGQPFFSMKFIEGTTLAKRLIDGPLPPREAASLLLPIAKAIAEAHDRGLLHRDLKPSNILIDDEGRPYVTDFGLAKRWSLDAETGIDHHAAASLTQSGAILGTPGYMAPEQAAGKRGKVSPLTDVYSLGALLYAMLTGRAPFQAASPVDTVLMVLEQDPPLPHVLNPKADRDLEMIALKCLQKPADLRYVSAHALADDLAAYLANEPISARSSHFTQVISRAFRETHHAGILENWGMLWMLHSAVLLILCLLTNWFQYREVTSRLPYFGLWTLGLGAWAAVFWNLRHRSGPVTFVERQIAHVWAGSMICSSGLFLVEWILDLPVLSLSPVLGLISAMVFLVKAGILTGGFYVQALALFATAGVMALLQQPGMPHFGISLFGVVSAACFFVPGLKYYRQRVRGGR